MRADPVPSPETTGTGETMRPVPWNMDAYLAAVGDAARGDGLSYIAPWQARVIAGELARLRAAAPSPPPGTRTDAAWYDLLDDYENAVFACGAWQRGDRTRDYETVHAEKERLRALVAATLAERAP